MRVLFVTIKITSRSLKCYDLTVSDLFFCQFRGIVWFFRDLNRGSFCLRHPARLGSTLPEEPFSIGPCQSVEALLHTQAPILLQKCLPFLFCRVPVSFLNSWQKLQFFCSLIANKYILPDSWLFLVSVYRIPVTTSIFVSGISNIVPRAYGELVYILPD